MPYKFLVSRSLQIKIKICKLRKTANLVEFGHFLERFNEQKRGQAASNKATECVHGQRSYFMLFILHEINHKLGQRRARHSEVVAERKHLWINGMVRFSKLLLLYAWYSYFDAIVI